jgi:hypothetical protein
LLKWYNTFLPLETLSSNPCPPSPPKNGMKNHVEMESYVNELIRQWVRRRKRNRMLMMASK